MVVPQLLLLLLGVYSCFASPAIQDFDGNQVVQAEVENRQDNRQVFQVDMSNEPRNPGKPLGPKDFHLASQLPAIPPNMTTDMMMKIVEYGELKGSVNNPEPDLIDVMKATKNGIAALENHWGNAVIPYTIDAAFTDSERAVIAQGIKQVEDNSCLRFVERNGEYDYVQIHPGKGGCYAVIPYRIGAGMREIGLEQDGCVYTKVVVHELLHAVGVKHEQCRPDRDDYITINWSNIQDGGPSQYFKDTWIGGDAPTNICKETLDYENCRSTFFTTACGFPYDYASVMHYSTTSFAIDPSQNVMTAKDTSVTTLGNTEMSELDSKKLQCLYNCDGTSHSECGGHFYGESGNLKAGADGSTGCEWLLRSPDGKGIVFDLSELQSAAKPCSEAYIEIRKGNADGPLVGKYCGTIDAAVIVTKASYLTVTFWQTSGTFSSGTKLGSWTVQELTCCDTLMVENFDGNTGSHGKYTKMNGVTENNAAVYAKDDNSDYLYLVNGNWGIGDDYTSGSIGLKSATGQYCPEDSGPWSYYNGQWTEDSDAAVRCSDCDKFPTYSECLTCCDTVKLETTTNLGAYSLFAGTYNLYTTQSTNDGQKVYKLDGENYCLYYLSGSGWKVNDCGGIGSSSAFVYSTSGSGCAHSDGISWAVAGGNGGDPNMKGVCDAECTTDPPAAPTGSTADDTSNKGVGTIVTYTCDTGAESKAICDAESLAWKPATIPSDLCSTPAPSPPSPTPPSPPSPTPPSPPSPSGPTPCQKKNKIPVLRGKPKKKVKTADACQALCTGTCIRWNWKNNKKPVKRTCWPMKVTLIGGKRARGFTSGERVASCGTGPIAAGNTILEGKKSILKTVKLIKQVKKANLCSDECTAHNSCMYYKWSAKKKMCWLMELSTKSQKGFSTA